MFLLTTTPDNEPPPPNGANIKALERRGLHTLKSSFHVLFRYPYITSIYNPYITKGLHYVHLLSGCLGADTLAHGGLGC